VSEYLMPFDQDVLEAWPEPEDLDWPAKTNAWGESVKVAWWVPAQQHWGGRLADVVISAAGEMYVFDRHGMLSGSAEAGSVPEPGMPTFWRLAEADTMPGAPFAMAHTLRGTGVIVAEVDGILGITLTEGAVQGTHGSWGWRVALGHVLLGFYPPLPGTVTPEEWKVGVGEIGEAAARRVKRALLQRTAAMGRALRKRSADLTANWN
jgi:hypothetical protein